MLTDHNAKRIGPTSMDLDMRGYRPQERDPPTQRVDTRPQIQPHLRQPGRNVVVQHHVIDLPQKRAARAPSCAPGWEPRPRQSAAPLKTKVGILNQTATPGAHREELMPRLQGNSTEYARGPKCAPQDTWRSSTRRVTWERVAPRAARRQRDNARAITARVIFRNPMRRRRSSTSSVMRPMCKPATTSR